MFASCVLNILNFYRNFLLSLLSVYNVYAIDCEAFKLCVKQDLIAAEIFI